MSRRLTALIIALFLIIPLVATTAESIELAVNPFESYDLVREAAIKGSAQEAYGQLSQKTAKSAPYITDGRTYIVRFCEQASLSDIYEIISDHEFSLLAHSSVRLFSVVIDDYEHFINMHREVILYIEEELEREVSVVTNDPLLSESWEFKKTDIFGAWNYTMGISSVIVAVLDTGIEREHEDFGSTTILPGYDTVNRRAGVYTDTNGHGTKVSGLIAGSADNGLGAAGVSPGVSIMPIRVSSTNTSISSANLILGLYFAADAGAKVINMSLGGYSSSIAEEDAVRFALSKGCILVASSGNDGAYDYGTEALYPASYEGVISVGSVGEDGTASNFSQHNEYVDVVAPGDGIPVMVYQNEQSGYKYDKGTSFSAAMVSGIAALAASYLDARVAFGSSEFLSLIRMTGSKKRDNYYGYGIINAVDILELVNLPIVTGVMDGETYFESVTIRYNRGSATLNGEVLYGGTEVVHENGQHVLEITYGAYKRTVVFNVDNSPLTYNYRTQGNYALFTFERGRATLNGFPYASGQHITASGEHFFVLSGGYGNTVTRRIKLSFDLPSVSGVEDGASYNTAVSIRIIGEGSATLNGNSFSGQIVVGDTGEHTLVVYNGTKSRSRAYSFTIENRAVSAFDTDLADANAIVDADYGYLILYSEAVQGIRVYDIENPSAYKRYLSIGKVNGYAFFGEYLIAFHDNKITMLNRDKMLGQSGHVESVINLNESISACVLSENEVYYSTSNSIKKINLDTQQRSTVSSTSFEADKAFLSESGEYIYMFNTKSNEKNAVIFEIISQTAFYADIPVSAYGKRIVYGSGLLAIGASVISEASFSLYSENSSSYPVLIEGDLLFTNEHIINTHTNECMAVFSGQVNNVHVDNWNRVFVFYADKTIMIISNSFSPTENFAPFRFMAADYKDIISAGSIAESEYSDFSSISSDRKIISFDINAGRLYAVCDGAPMLYVLDTDSMVQVDEIPLRFIPRQVFAADGMIYVSFKHSSLLYTAPAAAAGFGDYLNIGVIPPSFSISGDRLVTLKDGRVVVVDLITLELINTERTASIVRASGNSFYTSSGSIIGIYDLATFAFRGSISTGSVIDSFGISGDYIIAGDGIFSIPDRGLLYRTNARILAHRGNTLITESGVFDLTTGEYISTYESRGTHFYLDEDFNYYMVSPDSVVRVRSASGSDLTELPEISGIEQDGIYTDSASIEYTFGTGFVGTDKITSGAAVTKGGEHIFTLVLSCGIAMSVDFSIVPPIEGIEIIGGDRHMNVSETITLNVQFLPVGTTSTEIIFETRDVDIISVDQYGVVTALKPGVATVRALTFFESFYDECVITVSENLIRFDTSSGYRVNRDKGLVTGIDAGTSAAQIISAIVSEGTAEIIDDSGRRIDGVAGTGMRLVLNNSSGNRIDTLFVVVRGDISGDGYISTEDLYGMIDILENRGEYALPFLEAADINGNGRITNSDFTNLRAQLLYYGNALNINNPPPLSEATEIHSLLNTRIIEGERVRVTMQLSGARSIYAVSGRLFFDKELLEYEGFNGQSWNDTVYISEDGFISFITFENEKKTAGRSTKTLLTFEFSLKKDSAGKRLLFEAADTIIVSEGGRSHSLNRTQTERTVMHREDGEFSIRINNAREFEFSADIYDYRITVDHTVAALDIEADYPAGASVIISDTVIPESDRLSVSVIYIDPDGNSYNYYIDVTREEEYIADGNAYLSFLKVDGFELSPAFDKLINEYTLSVPYDTVQITLKYEPESEYCLAELQNPELLVGENIVKITCIAENGDINEYIITVTREAAAESEDSSEISETPVDKDFPNYIIYIALPVLAGGASAFVIIRKRRKQQA